MLENKIFYTSLFTALLGLILFGCSGNHSDSNTQPGTLSVSLTDAPSNGFDAVNVTVQKIRVHQSSSATDNDTGWSDITLTPARKINLLNLSNGVLDSLGQTSLPAGHYTQLRLVLSANTGTGLENSVVLSGTTTEITLDTPSAVQSGIKLVHAFDVAPGQQIDLLLDFDALKSVVKRGNGTYGLKPVINIIPFTLNGISGFVDPVLSGDHVLVTAQMNGVVERSTVPNVLTGEFFLARLDLGSYDIVLTADGRTTMLIAGVPISSSTSTALVSTAISPLTLPTSVTRNISGTIILNPTSSTEVPVVNAMQMIGGMTATVKYQSADGIYGLTLPIAAPLLGSYGNGTLPISLSTLATSTDAGQYTVEASAAGYQTKYLNVDILTTDAIQQDFSLTP
ncbi:MAG: hypothetical protein A2511_15820 [Deltaproteobacteria bacterium RIFOXYD12_FULL_50_9]|nr:MAG: hypothetical protein A2511_15820 [Deltaproteobacteria bacterium RIFOXYD12_FULL_50_9]